MSGSTVHLRALLAAVGAVAAAAGGCGRLGFDEAAIDASHPADARDPDAPQPPVAPFDVTGSGCLDADAGPFAEVAHFPSAGGGFGVWAAPPFVMMADTTGGLHDLRFDGTAFTEVGSLTGIGWVEAVWNDGLHYYVSSPGTGLSVVDADAAGALTLVTQNTSPLAQARHGWFGDGRAYIPAGSDGLFAVQFDGTALTQVGTPAPSLSFAQGVSAQGSRVWLADAGKLRVLDFDGSTFTDVIAPDTRHPGTSRLWPVGALMFVAASDGITVYRLDGTSLTELATFPTAASARDVWSDGVHVFAAAETDGFYALRFDGTALQVVDHVVSASPALGVFGDGTYIYANASDDGLRAYAGFRCKRW